MSSRLSFALPSAFTLRPNARSLRLALLSLSLGLCAASAQAGLFDDDEARRAILDLRAEIKQLREGDVAKLSEQNSALQRSLLDLQAQIEQLKQTQAQQTGRLEEIENRQSANTAARTANTAEMSTELAADSGTAAQGSADSQAASAGLVAVRLDGQSLQVSSDDKRQFDASLSLFQAGNFAGAERSLSRLVAQNPSTPYAPWVHYWVGNSQFAQKRYSPAVDSFRRVISLAPANPKAPEAALSIANCQSQLGQAAESRRTLENLIKVYPRSEAADSARERIAQRN